MQLQDRFHRPHTYLRVAVTDRCNLRCSYCMPETGVQWRPRPDLLTLEEILRIVRMLACRGVRKVRLTGGEPLVRSNLCWLIERIAELPGIETVGLTTNGTLLRQHVRELKRSGLRKINVSLDSLKPERFAQIARVSALGQVLDGIDAAFEAGFEQIKLNTVILSGVNDDELCDFVELARERPLHIRFIEFMPFPGNQWGREQLVPWRILRDRLRAVYQLRPIENAPDDVARSFHIDGLAGTVSFISPLSEEFCAGCNRLRLTADGSIKTCLLYPAEMNIRHALRAAESDDDILAMICNALQEKHYSHPPTSELVQLDNRCMSLIGG